MRWVELALFLMPFATYGIWVWRGRRHGTAMLAGTVALAIVAVLVVAWLELSQSVPPDVTYIPPHMQGERLVPAQAVRRPAP